MRKSLVIDTAKEVAPGDDTKWSTLKGFSNNIKEIKTPGIDDNVNLNQIVSAIPSPLARAKMFKYALLYDPGDAPLGIQIVYAKLLDEWKGLLACIALNTAKLQLRRVELQYTLVKAAKVVSRNIFEPKGAIGSMLFEDKLLWSIQGKDKDEKLGISGSPFIYLIKYIINKNNSVLIGGTSPESLIFTSPNYKLEGEDAPYINDEKFSDPLKNAINPLNQDQTQILYNYISHIFHQLKFFEKQFDPISLNIGYIQTFIEKWRDQIMDYAIDEGYDIDTTSFPINVNIFQPPFSKVFNTENIICGKEGAITKFPKDGYIQFDPAEELLINDQFNTVVEIEGITNPNTIPVYMLKVGERFFSIPLAAKGSFIFQNHLDDLLGISEKPSLKSSLKAEYNAPENKLTITFYLDVDGNVVSFQRIYGSIKKVSSKNLITWPNFTSPIWNDYYLYSEFPDFDKSDLWVAPIQASKSDYQISGLNGNSFTLSAQKIISHKFNTGYSYEIYKSNEPFRGIEFLFKLNEQVYKGGVLLLKGFKHGFIQNYSKLYLNPSPTDVGFDFGSNNICVSYKSNAMTDPALISLNNRRVYILGEQIKSADAALPHEVLFFPSEIILGNYIKSMIALHDQTSFAEDHEWKRREISGGLPCSSSNLQVTGSDKNLYDISLNTNQGSNNPSINVLHSLKWVEGDGNGVNVSLYALVKSIWLMTYAELLVNEFYPKTLKWAYPSSMPKHLVNQYVHLWNEAVTVNPIKSSKFINAHASQHGKGTNKALTEAEAVANFALSNACGMTIDGNTMVMGFDIGGSTSDFFCIVQDKQMQTKLIRQTSIRRLSAGKLAEATSKSPAIQGLLQEFCNTNHISIFGINNNLNGNTASYYFNAIVDKLSVLGDDMLQLFYTHLNTGLKEMFVVNTYLTGLLIFHAGQISARMAQEDEYKHIKRFQLGFFGRGGRMQGWWPAINENSANGYFTNCFRKGFAQSVDIDIELFQPTLAYTKTEVAFGLSLFNLVHGVDGKRYDIIGESGYTFNNRPLEELKDLQDYTEPILANPGGNLRMPDKLERFSEFLSIFLDFVHKEIGYPRVKIATKSVLSPNDIGIIPYVKSLPEWQNAINKMKTDPGEFDFHTSLLVLEGMAFFENKLMPALFD